MVTVALAGCIVVAGTTLSGRSTEKSKLQLVYYVFDLGRHGPFTKIMSRSGQDLVSRNGPPDESEIWFHRGGKLEYCDRGFL